MFDKKEYLGTIKDRAKKSHVYKRYQMIGLLIAQLLNDEKHKALYIKLAKKHHSDDLLHMAKDISERKNIENKGGYFMRVILKTHPYLFKSQKSETKKTSPTDNAKAKNKKQLKIPIIKKSK